jgi:hypothetical protein
MIWVMMATVNIEKPRASYSHKAPLQDRAVITDLNIPPMPLSGH